jgi:hypothetical protein
VTDELRHHWTLHLLDEDSARHEAQLAKHPEQRKVHETRVAAARKALTANAAQSADAQKQRRVLEQEIAAFDTAEARFQQQLERVTDQKQFEAVQHEIAAVRAKRSDVETAALELLEREEGLAAASPPLTHALEKAENDAAVVFLTLDTEAARLNAELAALAAKRADAVALLDAPARSLYERLRGLRGGRAVAAFERGACGACFRTQPPVALQEARKGLRLLSCDGCGRLLMMAPEGGATE